MVKKNVCTILDKANKRAYFQHTKQQVIIPSISNTKFEIQFQLNNKFSNWQ